MVVDSVGVWDGVFACVCLLLGLLTDGDGAFHLVLGKVMHFRHAF